MEQPSSNLFEGYKSVGQVTGHYPLIVRHGKNPQDTRIVTIVGRTFHTYTTNLSLVEVSIPHEYDISMIISDENHIYSASDRTIFCWDRGSKSVAHKLDNGHQASVELIAKLGQDYLVSIDADNILFHWRISDKEILNIISFEPTTFKITSICCPLNYSQKILIGSQSGQLELWNVKDEKCLYQFKGWDSKVMCLVQSPVEDVIGIGLEDGNIHIHNIKYDEVIMKIYQEYGPVTSMSFRLDNLPYLVTASSVGHLMIWNLERKKLSSQIRNAHADCISKCQFIRNESLLVTSGHDNSLKVWSLDASDGGGNLLHQRSGHSEPPRYIRFYGPKGFNLLSAGGDSTMKMFHLYSERLNRNLGTARINPKTKNKHSSTIQKLPPISCFAAETAKEKQWDSIAACHKDSSLVTTWNYDKCRMGEHLIMQPSFDKHDIYARSICISSCGHFVVIGFSNGLIFKYNMQSGLFRETYESKEITDHRAHDGPVTGVAVDSLDLVLISGGTDMKLRLWNFKTGVIFMVWDCPAPILKLELHRENNLLAIALENNDVEIRDLEARTLVRKFSNSSKINDIAFTPDSRWLIVAHDDRSIRTYDLNLGKLIDSFLVSSACTSLTVSSTGEFLATAHEGSLGINIWCNYTIYFPTTLRAMNPNAKPMQLDMPYVRCDDLSPDDDEEAESDGQILVESTDLREPDYISPDQLDKTLITLSGLPSSRWKNLLSIEEVREQQRIQEDERNDKRIKVPFFIPVKDGLKPELDSDAIKSQLDADSSSSTLLSKIRHISLLSPLAKCLIECAHENDFSSFIDKLKDLGPSATDVEIRTLGSDICGDNKPMLCFLDAIEYSFKRNLEYELVNSWLALFLKAHSDLIQSDIEVQRRCLSLSDMVASKWDGLREQFNQVFCVMNYVRSSIL